MSIKVLAKISLKDCQINFKDKIKLSFKITNIGVKHKIGTNFGANIANNFSEILENLEDNEILFELTDNPMDINAEMLFLGEGVSLIVCDEKIDTSETLHSRMNRVENFIIDLLSNKDIKVIQIDIDALNTFDYQSFEKISIKPDQFTNTIIRLFEKNNQSTPTIRINFSK